MQVEKSSITKYFITDLENYRLDPITVICEDIEPKKGKIIIECYGESWSGYWGSISENSIAEFFCNCNESYIADKISGINSYLSDYEQIPTLAKTEICQLRRNLDISKSEARDLWNEIPHIENRNDAEHYYSFFKKIFLDDWWGMIPEKTNPKYEYLCRIIKATQEALSLISTKNSEKNEINS